MEWQPRLLGGILLVAVMPVLAGCGSGSSSADSAKQVATASGGAAPGRALSRSEFIARTDGICQRLNSEIAKFKAKSATAHEIERFAPPHAALEQATVTELSKLTAPASIAREWGQIVAFRRKLAEELLQLGQAAHANDSARMQALVSSKLRAHKQLLEVGRRAGFKSCSLVG